MEQLNGNEPFTLHGSGTSIMLQDFWRWAYSDLLNNTHRGVLAEFLVHSALETKDVARADWLPFDLTSPSGLRIEVKSSAYLQAWTPEDVFSRRLASTLQRNLPGMELPTPLWLCVTVIYMCSASLPLVHVTFQFLISTTGTFMFCLPRFLTRRCRSRKQSRSLPSSNLNQQKRISPVCLRLWNQ